VASDARTRIGMRAQGATTDDYAKYSEALKKLDLELKLTEAPLGISED